MHDDYLPQVHVIRQGEINKGYTTDNHTRLKNSVCEYDNVECENRNVDIQRGHRHEDSWIYQELARK